jgi:DNA repair exonuclease SbcCD ATPase subunit
MTAIRQRYENCQVQPTTPAPEVQARLSALEKEVATLKALLQSRDEELTSLDLIISEERSATARLKKEVFEANEQYTRSVASLSSELDHTDQLASRLLAV